MTDTESEINRLFRAVADSTRRRIIEELLSRERQSLFEIYTRVLSQHGVGQSRQAFSRHLLVLEEVGIVNVEWQGTTKLHSVNTAPLSRLRDGWFAKFGDKQ